MHKVAPEIEASIKIPLLHIVDATAERISAKGMSKVGLLGTRFTMEHDFYRKRLAEKHGINAIVPNTRDRDLVNKVIYNELCVGKIHERSQGEYIRIIGSLAEEGAEAVILGCTEIALLIQQEHTSVSLLDTTKIHVLKIVEEALIASR